MHAHCTLPKYAENLRRSIVSEMVAVTDIRRRLLAVLSRNTGLVRHFEKAWIVHLNFEADRVIFLRYTGLRDY